MIPLESIFNPSNDMALAANVRQYLPPRRIQQMEADLAELARVWDGTRFSGPWGWSLATKQRYRRMGVAEELLPSDEWLTELRRLSSREFACGYVSELLAAINDERLLGREMRWVDGSSFDSSALIASESTTSWSIDRSRRGRPTDHDVVDLGAVDESLLRIFKSPWSSSGRGVFVTGLEGQSLRGKEQGARSERILCRLQGFLSSQGGFLVDRFYADKVLDFAMEFFVNDDGSVDSLGYSVFHAADTGAYGYNYVESQEELLGRIMPSQGEEQLLEQLIAYHKEHLGKTAYRGPVGIDMLKTADGHIHPCLEINFRMNMGILALLLYERYGSGCTIQLTPRRPNGFEALVERGKLMLTYCRQ